MPEKGIDRKRLREHFRRLWAVYLIGAVALCFLNHLIYTVTRPSYSEEQTFKLMLVNVELQIDEEELLEAVRTMDGDIRAAEVVSLAGVVVEDPTSVMLLSTQLVSGFGDMYYTDAAGLEVLINRRACLPLEIEAPQGWTLAYRVDPESGEEFAAALERADGSEFLTVASNGTNVESTLKLLPILAEKILEGET